MEEQVSNPSEFLRLVKSFLSAQNPSKFPALAPVIQQLVEVCNDITAIKCVVSHLRAIRHYIKVKEGKSLYLRAVYSSELDRLIEEGEKVLGPTLFCWGGELQPPAKATIIERKDDRVSEKKLEQEQFHLDDNPLFHNLLRSIWLYAVEKGFESKTIFISYAWPIGNVHEEAWTKTFVEKLAYHLVSAGFQVYLDDIQGGAGFPLDEFMSKLKKCDHVLLISSRTMAEKLKKPESGVNQEKRKIIEHLEKQDSSFRARVVIPVLLNYSNYCDPLFASLAEVPMCVDGYLGSLSKLLPRLFGDSKERFEKWFDLQLKKEQVKLFEGVPRFSEKRVPREGLLLDVELKLKTKRMVVITGEAGTGKTELAVAYCHSAEAKQRYHQIFWIENGTKIIPEIPEGSLVVLNDVEDLKGCINNVGLWGDVAVLITTREDCIGLSHVSVSAFNREEAIECVEKFLWNKEVHKPELISALVEYAGVNPRKLREVIDEINRNKLNIPRYLRLQGREGFDVAVEEIEVIAPELQRGITEENKNEKGKEEASDMAPLTFKFSEQIRPWNIPIRNPNFAGRDNLLGILESRLTFQGLDNVKAVAITACDGLGGIGKTQLAVEFAHRYRGRFRFVIWISAETAEQIQSAYLQLGHDLKIFPEKMNPLEAIEIIKHYLSSRPGNLLIFDGALNYSEVEQFIPSTGCSVLITSRTEHGWPEKPLSVPVFSKEDGREYVRKVLEDISCSDEDIDKLGEAVGWLPLALAQAVAYIWVHKISVREYLMLLSEIPEPMLSSEIMPLLDKHASVYRTFQLAMKSIEEKYPLARVILIVIAFLDYSKIPGMLFESLVELNSEKVKKSDVAKVIGILSQHSLITIDTAYCIGIHQLLNRIVWMTSGPRLMTAYLNFIFKMLLKNFPDGQNVESLASVARYRLFLPHAEKFVSWLNDSANLLFEMLLDKIEYSLGLLGDTRKQQEYLQRAIPLKEKLHGKDSVVVACALNNLGIALRKLGDPLKAKECLQRSLKLKRQHYGSDHLEVAKSLFNLSYCHGELGEMTECARQRSEVLAIVGSGNIPEREKAIWLGVLGDLRGMESGHAAGLVFKREASEAYKNTVGGEHVFFASALRTQASSEKATGNLKQGCELLEKALIIFKRHYDAGHPEIGHLLIELSRAYSGWGDMSTAYERCKEGLQVLESYFGEINIQIVSALVELANIYRELGKLNESCELLERASRIRRQLHQEDDVYSGMIQASLGNSWVDKNELHKGCEFLESALRIFEGEQDLKNFVDVTKAMMNLALAYIKLEKWANAQELFERALKIKAAEYGESHPEIAMLWVGLADTYTGLGEPDRAETLLRQALIILETHCFSMHPAIAGCLLSLGNACAQAGKKEEACDHLKRSLALRSEIYGAEHPRVAAVLTLLGITYGALGKVVESIAVFELALPIQERHCGVNSVEVSAIHYGVGLAYKKLEDFESAFEYLTTAYNILADLPGFGPNHFRVISLKRVVDDVKHELARTSFGEEVNLDESEEESESRVLRQKLLSLLMPDTQKMDNLVGEITKELDNVFGDNKTAEELEREVLTNPEDVSLRLKLVEKYIQQNNLEKSIFHAEAVVHFVDGKDVSWLNQVLGCLYHSRGSVAQAEECFQVALSCEASAAAYCNYGFLLFSQQRFEETIENLLVCISIDEDKSSFVFSLMEMSRVDKFLQGEIKKQGRLEVGISVMAYYWLISCYHQLGAVIECEKRLKEFRGLVEASSSAFSWRLLGALYTYIGQEDNAEECEAIQMSLDVHPQEFLPISESGDIIPQSPQLFLQRTKALLEDFKFRASFSALTSVVDALINYCNKPHENESTAVECLVSHLRAIRHYIKVKEGRSLYLRSIYSSELDDLITEGERILGAVEFCWGGELEPPAKATIIERKDDAVRESTLNQEQFNLDVNPLFHNLLRSIWLYALENEFASKSIFLSYAWPIGNVHEEAWTKVFVEKLAYHLVAAGFQVYLDDIQGGAGFPLDEFMSKLKKCDHVLLISSRTMAEKLKKPESGVNQEKRKILEHLEKQDSSFRKRVVIPILLNYSNYCDPLFASLAEVPMCVDGYLGSLCKLLPRLFGDSKERFERWFDVQLKKEQVRLFEGVPRYSTKRIAREKLLLDVELKLKAKCVVVITGEAGTGKTELAVAYCHSTEAKQKYHQIFWIENGTKIIPEIPEGSLVVLNDVEDLKGCINNLGLWGGVAVLITTREDCIGLSYVSVPAFNQEEAVECVEKFLWNKEVHKPELISALVEDVGVNPRRLGEIVDKINRNKLNIPRYLRLQGREGFDDAIEEIEILEPELRRGSKEEKDDKGKEEASALDTLIFKPSEQMRPWRLPMRNPNFTGRKKLLKELESRLAIRELNNVNPVAITACEGMGGIGKTTLAIEYAHRYRSRFRFIIWISAENADQIRAAYLALGQDLSILPEKVKPEEVTVIVKNYLSAKPGNLVIFDGGKYDDIKQFIPESGCSVLVPTRVEHGWPEKPVSVPLFSPQEARKYVRKILSDRIDCSDKDIDALGQVLGWLPLAFAQAVAYIWMQKITIREYLALFSQVPVELLQSEAMPALDTHPSVYVTFTLTLRAIEEVDPFALKILKFCSLLSHEKIPGVLLDFPRVEESLGLLSQYSLVSCDSRYSFNIHAVLRKTVQSRLSPVARENYIEAIANLLIKSFSFNFELLSIRDVSLIRTLGPHLIEVLSQLVAMTRELNFNVSPETRFMANGIQYVIIILGFLDFGYQVLDDVVNRKEFLEYSLKVSVIYFGRNHFSTVDYIRHLGAVYAKLGDAQKSVLFLESALPHFEKRGNAVATASLLEDLGRAYGDLDNARKMRSCFEEAFALLATCLDENDHRLARLKANMPTHYFLGNFEEEKRWIEDAVSVLEKHCEPNSQNHGHFLERLGEVNSRLNNFEESKKYFKHALRIFERHYGSSHYQVARLQFRLGRVYIPLKKYEKSKRFLCMALSVTENHFGKFHGETADVLASLGSVFLYLGEVEEGRRFVETAMEIQRKTGKKLDICETMLRLSHIYYAQQDFGPAVQWVTQAHQEFMNHPDGGVHHPHAKIYKFALEHVKSRKDAKELENLERALEDPELLIKRYADGIGAFLEGDAEPLTQMFAEDGVGDVLEKALRHQLGMSLDKPLEEAMMDFLGSDELNNDLNKVIDKTDEEHEEMLVADPEDIKLRLVLARSYFRKSNLEKSIFHFEQVADFVEEHDAVEVNQSLGCLYHIQGNIEQAERYFLTALSYIAIATTHRDYGLFLFSLGRYAEAAQNFLLGISSLPNLEIYLHECDVPRLDPDLQAAFKKIGTLEISQVFFSCYWLVRCYHRLEYAEECEKKISELRSAVELAPTVTHWCLLASTYRYVGRNEDAEECEAIQMSLKPEDEIIWVKDVKEEPVASRLLAGILEPAESEIKENTGEEDSQEKPKSFSAANK